MHPEKQEKEDFNYGVSGTYTNSVKYTSSIIPSDTMPTDYKSFLGKICMKGLRLVKHARFERNIVMVELKSK